ncbi:MAG: DKNYY domain-containing protein [Acidobacteria bacterium]|nr:DKNYY domain-containing protein [Acidobacteriota bacterium]
MSCVKIELVKCRVITCLCGIILCFSGCQVGYKKVDGKWSYVTWNEAEGYRTHKIGADDSTFEILGNKKYAKDKNKVYYKGDPILGADPLTFVLLEGGDYANYAKDKDHVYLLYYPVLNADPNSFSEIKFPYAKDKKSIYCGTLPMSVKNIEEFEVLQSASGYIISGKDFIEHKEEYSFLKDLPQDTVVVYSNEGKAKTKTEYFEGCKKK